jgi:hypothetical protein
MNLTRKFLPLVAFASIAFGAAPALADAITLNPSDVGQSYTFAFDGFSDGTTISGLTSTATFTLTGTTANSYTFNYSLSNTTSDPVNSRLSGFAFNTDPNISSATSTGAFSYTTLGGNYPNGIGSVEVCFKDASTGSCAGGGSGGLLDGQTGTGAFTLNFSQPLTSLTLSDFFVRYQSITGAGNVSSATGSGTLSSTSGGTNVPEPGMLGLMGSALLAVGLLRRRRKAAPALVAALA